MVSTVSIRPESRKLPIRSMVPTQIKAYPDNSEGRWPHRFQSTLDGRPFRGPNISNRYQQSRASIWHSDLHRHSNLLLPYAVHHELLQRNRRTCNLL